MKRKTANALLAALLLALLVLCCSCTGTKPGDQPSTEPEESVTDASESVTEPAESSGEESEPATEPGEPDPERAMDNFVRKLDECNYVVEPKDYVKTTAYSPEQIRFTDDADSDSSINVAFITRNGETFQVELGKDRPGTVQFVAPGNAPEALGEILPNNWMSAGEGNMFNLFYNNVDNPLEFTSKEESVKRTLLTLGGYSESALSVMGEVHMLLDAENPSAVHFTAELGSVGMLHYEDLDLTLRFGVAESDPRVEAWLSDPYFPPTRTSWTQNDIDMMDIVFFRGYGKDTVPFPSFASYALIFDDKAYDVSRGLRISDAHGTEADLDAYKTLLLSKGYEEKALQLEDGSTVTVYRRLLREEYRSYAQLYPYFDNGFVLEGELYYDDPAFDGLEAISAEVQKNGFAALPETDTFTGWNAENSAASRSEGWAYFFDYDLYMPMMLSYTDQDAASAYLENYGKALLDLGFVSGYVPNDVGGLFTARNGFTSFRYTFGEEGTVVLEFKSEKSLSPEELRNRMTEHGFPEVEFPGEVVCRDNTRYRYEVSEFQGLFLLIYQEFETTEQAEAFLNALVPSLDEQGYLMMDPDKLSSQKAFLYFNEELAKYVAFDLIPEADSTSVNMEFVSIEPEESEFLQSALRR